MDEDEYYDDDDRIDWVGIEREMKRLAHVLGGQQTGKVVSEHAAENREICLDLNSHFDPTLSVNARAKRVRFLMKRMGLV